MIAIRSMSADDLPLGLDLKEAAGWNQTESDWRRALELEPEGCFVGVGDGVAAATLTTAIFGRVAWVAMVLTHPEFRGRGLATTLLKHALSWLEARQVTSVRLDATALGRPVYERLGFRVVGESARFFGRTQVAIPKTSDGGAYVPLTEAALIEAGRLDAAATGNDRTRLLAMLRRDWPAAGLMLGEGDRLSGFCLARRGSRATQIGPCIAPNRRDGRRLLDAALRTHGTAGAVVDLPLANVSACDFVRERGLDVERAFFRMTLGDEVTEHSEAIWGNFGPEKG